MNEAALLSLMPTRTIDEERIEKTIEEQESLIQQGNNFLAMMSMNRYLRKQLNVFTLSERLTLFSLLHGEGLSYEANPLVFTELTVDAFTPLLGDVFGLKNIYALDNLYIENLLKGTDILNTEVAIDDDEAVTLSELLPMFVFQGEGMSMGDAAPLHHMFTVKKALLGTHLASVNVASLEEGKTDIYDISVLL
ncbi:hypothetical protein IMZ31_22280 (plasmid) [Pontibacillus sp. ALD_SL1]|uniref:hypothetical protein n=1 Tax=Pontibacillus sp. ALD_SL1 TaxID=2777185 RepID=UPI001A97323C|nr:hypothetical protein [Pontibacillus sp. ALD_SL1]QST02183.1 hypothetical protein IMZ31_22280 [Pontibacillus sp. ALD_SL1]